MAIGDVRLAWHALDCNPALPVDYASDRRPADGRPETLTSRPHSSDSAVRAEDADDLAVVRAHQPRCDPRGRGERLAGPHGFVFRPGLQREKHPKQEKHGLGIGLGLGHAIRSSQTA